MSWEQGTLLVTFAGPFHKKALYGEVTSAKKKDGQKNNYAQRKKNCKCMPRENAGN